ncbi:CHC2 zinc finger domain-containing protein, partial [Roseateles saccharophilus]
RTDHGAPIPSAASKTLAVMAPLLGVINRPRSYPLDFQERLKKAGKDRMGRCPLREDGTASLVVTLAKNLWHCLGCGAGGGPID